MGAQTPPPRQQFASTDAVLEQFRTAPTIDRDRFRADLTAGLLDDEVPITPD